MNKKKVLILSASDHFDPTNLYSAIAMVMVSMGELLQNHGYEVYINHSPINDILNSIKQKGVPPINKSIPQKVSRIGKLLPNKIKLGLKEILNQRRLKMFYKSFKGSQRPDVVIEFLYYGSSVGCQLAQDWKCSFISVYDSPLEPEYEILMGSKPIFNFIRKNEKLSVIGSKKIIVYSKALAEQIRKEISEKADCMVHQFLDFNHLEYLEPRENFELIHVGVICSFQPWQHVDYMIDVYNNLRTMGYQFKLFLMGGGAVYEQIYNYAQKTKFGSEIEFTNFIAGERLRTYIQRLHIGVITNNLWYQAPMKIFQYWAANLACIAPGTPCIREICEGNDATLLFEPHNIPDLQQNLMSLIDQKEKIKILAQRNQEFVKEKYGRKVTFLKYENLITEVTGS